MEQDASPAAPSAIDVLRARGITEPITMGFILGTGLGSITDELQDPVCIDYADLPGFPEANVSGHAGRLWIGQWEGTRVAIMEGRAHYYETGDARVMAPPLATLRDLGANTLVLTNSAGSVNLDWHPGSVAIISDHINFSGHNPLIGDRSDRRFVNLREAYDRRLRARFRQAAAGAGKSALHEGVYMWFSGPSFETPAEVKMAKLLGADLVAGDELRHRHQDRRSVPHGNQVGRHHGRHRPEAAAARLHEGRSGGLCLMGPRPSSRRR